MFRTKLGRCAGCIRLSSKLAFLGGGTALAVDWRWPHSGLGILILSVALGLAALRLAHLTIFAGRAANAVARAEQAKTASGRDGRVTAAPDLGRRRMIAVFVKMAVLAAVATALPARLAAGCVSLPICRSQNSDCTCSGRCGEWKSPPCPSGICQPSC